MAERWVGIGPKQSHKGTAPLKERLKASEEERAKREMAMALMMAGPIDVLDLEARRLRETNGNHNTAIATVEDAEADLRQQASVFARFFASELQMTPQKYSDNLPPLRSKDLRKGFSPFYVETRIPKARMVQRLGIVTG